MATLKTLVVGLELQRSQFSGELDAAIAGLDSLDDQVIELDESIVDFGDGMDTVAENAGGGATQKFKGLGQGINEVEGALKSAGAELSSGNLAGGVEDLAASATNLTAKLSGAAGVWGTIGALAVSIGASIFAWRNRQKELNDELERTAQMKFAADFSDVLGDRVENQVQAAALAQQLRDATTSDAASAIEQQLRDQLELQRVQREEIKRSIDLLSQDIPTPKFEDGWLWGEHDYTARDEYIAEFIDPLEEQLENLRGEQSVIAGALGDAQRKADSLEISEEVAEAEAAQSAALVDRLSTVGEFFNQLPEAVEPIADNIVAAENQLHALDQQVQDRIAEREAQRQEQLQQLADAPAQLTENLQRGSAEAFRTILQQQQDAPLRRLESVAVQQLQELQQMNQRRAERSRALENDEGEDL